MGRHEHVEAVVPEPGEPVEAAPAEALDPAQEAWSPTFDFARDLATTLVRGFGRTAAAVEAAGGIEVDEDDGIRVKTEAGGWLDEVAPQAAYVPLERASWLRRVVTPVAEDSDGIKFGWVVAERERQNAERPKADDEDDGEDKDTKRRSSRADIDELEDEEDEPAVSRVETDEEGEVDDPDLDVVVERVLVVAGVRNALRLVVGTRKQLDGHEGPLMRVPVLKPVVDEDGKKVLPGEADREIIDAYADRNQFVSPTRQVITPELIAEGKLDSEDPEALGWAVREGLADLSDRLEEIVRQAEAATR
jgi:hypothetical protein